MNNNEKIQKFFYFYVIEEENKDKTFYANYRKTPQAKK